MRVRLAQLDASLAFSRRICISPGVLSESFAQALNGAKAARCIQQMRNRNGEWILCWKCIMLISKRFSVACGIIYGFGGTNLIAPGIIPGHYLVRLHSIRTPASCVTSSSQPKS